MIITLTPNPSIDWTLDVSALAPGQVHRATQQIADPLTLISHGGPGDRGVAVK